MPNVSAERWVVSQENAEAGQIRVHKQDGNMDYYSIYEEDPAWPPG